MYLYGGGEFSVWKILEEIHLNVGSEFTLWKISEVKCGRVSLVSVRSLGSNTYQYGGALSLVFFKRY